MDHGGRFEKEGRIMSQAKLGGVNLCDNLPSPEVLSAHTRNLNEAITLAQTESGPQLRNDGGRRLIHDASLNNEEGGRRSRTEDEHEEEDIDEVMKDEEEESEESSCLILCQSPDTPMTDSSYSETGSLLDTPYLFSPGTSPEPTSPVIPAISLETAYPISPPEWSQGSAASHFGKFYTGSAASTMRPTPCTPGPAFTMEPVSPALTLTSDLRQACRVEPAGVREATAQKAKNANITTEHLTSPTELGVTQGRTCNFALPGLSTEPMGSSVQSNSVASSVWLATSSATPVQFTQGPTNTGTEPTTALGSMNSKKEAKAITSLVSPALASPPTTGTVCGPSLMTSLEQLAQKGDDNHFPQYLHQIAEAFVLHEDYQQALWCIQLEQLYHQRVLDNLNALQEEWEGRCKKQSTNLESQHLDPLRDICLTHTRPRTADAVCASMDFLKPTFEGGGVSTSCPSDHQGERVMEQRDGDSSPSQGCCAATPPVNLPDRLDSPETLDGKESDSNLQGWDLFHGTELTEKEGRGQEEGEADEQPGSTISDRGDEIPPSTNGAVDQSKPAEQQGGDSDTSQREKVDKEEKEKEVEDPVEALEMDEEEGEEEEEDEKWKERHSSLDQKILPVETIGSGTDVEVQHLHKEDLTKQRPQADIALFHKTQESNEPSLYQAAHLIQEAHMKQQEQDEVRDEEEEEEDYEVEQADIIREAATLDDMAKLITVEEMSPVSGLVSILKKRSVCVNDVTVSACSEPPRRRVRFKVPDDGFEAEVGGGDSCLLLFLLCLVTVVISVGGTALYCALGDVNSSVCQDFSRNADFYAGQMQRVFTQIQHWFSWGS